MKRTNKIHLIATLAISAGLYACSSGSNNSTSSQVVGFQGGDYGPISINMYDSLLSAKLNPVTTKSQLLKGAGAAADTAAATGVMAAVFPPAAIVLGPISAISGLVSADQVAAQINQINNELNYQESQIQQIYAILNASYNYFVDQSKVEDVTNFTANYANWYNNVPGELFFYGYGASHSQVSPIYPNAPIDAKYQSYMNRIMLAAPSGPTESINLTVTDTLATVAINPSAMSGISSLTYGMSLGTQVQQLITNASMSSTVVSSDDTVATVESGATSVTYTLLNSAESVMRAAIPTVNSPNPYFVNVAESYNNFVNSVYLANIFALQSMYAIEATNNYLNYLNYMATESGVQLSQICPLEGLSSNANSVNNIASFYVSGSNPETCSTIPTTVYFESNIYNPTQYSQLTYANAESAFVFAQQQLTQLYARRINVLYQQTMQFIYSDHAYPNQGVNYIDGESSLSGSMQAIISNTPQLKLIESNILGLSMISGSWVNFVDLYQYPITNLDVSRTNITNGISAQESANSIVFPVIPAINNSNYPTVYQNIQSGYYDGESISVYNNYFSVNSSQNPFYFAGYCGIESIGSYNTVESGLSFIGNTSLYYNNWGGSLMANSTTLNANLNIESVPLMEQLMYTPQYINYGNNYYTYVSSSNEYCPYPYEETCVPPLNNMFIGSYNSWFRMANNPDDSYTYYVASNSLGNNNFMLLASSSSNGSTPVFKLESGNFYTAGFGMSFQLDDGGFEVDINSIFTHSALLQVTLPNGYNLPFYVFSYIDYGNHTYSSPICPGFLGISVSGIEGCGQQEGGNGGLSVVTADGNTYYLNVLQPSSGQGMQYGLFQINTTPQTSS